jgi:serine/threonine protein phosphatase 1
MGKTYAVADFHGMRDLWNRVKFHLNPDDTLYVLGDATDRGASGWAILKDMLKDSRVIYLRGNHDQMILDCWRSDWCDNYIWFYNGGYQTYEDILSDEKHEIYLIELAKSKLYHCYVNKEGQRIHLSHAGFTLMEDGELPTKKELLWDREHIDDHCDWWPDENPTDYVVHGHTGCVSNVFKARSATSDDTIFNDSKTVCRYAHGHKICIDGRSFHSKKIALLDLDTLQETIFEF